MLLKGEATQPTLFLEQGMGAEEGAGSPEGDGPADSPGKELWKAWACCCGYTDDSKFTDDSIATSYCPGPDDKLAKEYNFAPLMKAAWDDSMEKAVKHVQVEDTKADAIIKESETPVEDPTNVHEPVVEGDEKDKKEDDK
jgi:hypothetical protein